MYRVIVADKDNDTRDLYSGDDYEEALRIAEDFDGNAAGKYDSTYIYQDDHVIWVDGRLVVRGNLGITFIDTKEKGV